MPQAVQQSTTRRALMSAAPAIAALAIPAAALAAAPTRGASQIPQEWRNIIASWSSQHPDGGRVALRAYERGLWLDDLIWVQFEGPQLAMGSYPFAMFRTDTGWINVHPDVIVEGRREERGEPLHMGARV